MGIAILFSGQGTHHPGMFDILLESPSGARYVERACAVLGLSRERLDGLLSQESVEGRYAQPLIATLGYGVWDLIRERVPRPVAMVGYSLGELIAYACAGAFDFETMLRMCEARARFMEEAVRRPAGLVSVSGVRLEELKRLCVKTQTYIAIINGDDHCVVGGEAGALARMSAALDERGGASHHPLPINIPSHTPLMAEASSRFEEYLRELPIHSPSIPVISTAVNQVLYARDDLIRTLAEQMRNTVRWAECMQTASEMGAEVFFEIGPGSSLGQITERLLPDARVHSIDEFKAVEGIARWLNKAG
ncbi:MAG: malonate decarboxylase subunit epsilon [Candidatus Aureabacteria bacterium]|nr:malonate decarboxylase subunit epsilon [Candidatus Auribacterota bacterium]